MERLKGNTFSHDWVKDLVDKLDVDAEEYLEKNKRVVKETDTVDEVVDKLIKNALENIDEASPNWTYVASNIYREYLYMKASENRGEKEIGYGDFYRLIDELVEKGIYNEDLLTVYSKEDIRVFQDNIVKERDGLCNYLGLHTLATRYLATDYEKNVFGLPQERFMIIAMWLMLVGDEEKRNEYVLEAYWALSNLYMTVATPTLNNAGKTHGQLSSCFIDTVEDSLESIYGVNTDVAQLSKNGGGLGVYMGKVRGRGSE